MPPVKVGVIGAGLMGGGMGRTLLRKGYDVTIFDLSPEIQDRFRQDGAKIAASPKALAQAVDFVISVLPDSPHVEQTYLGPNGVLEGCHTRSFCIESSTIDPAVSLKVQNAVRAAGFRMIDSSLNRGPKEAEEGTLIFMVGASQEDYKTALPLLEAMGTDIFYCGGPSHGITMKVINNILTQAIMCSDIEALGIGVKAGLDPQVMLKVLTNTNANNGPLHNLLPNNVLKGDYRPGFKCWMAHKDMGLAHDLAARLGVPLFTLGPVRQFFSAALGRGRGEETSAVVATVMEELAGIKFGEQK